MAAKPSRVLALYEMSWCLPSKKAPPPTHSTHHNVGIGKIQKARLGGTDYLSVWER